MQLFANNVETTLSANLTTSATSLTVADATGMPSPTGGDYFLLTLCKRAANIESSFEIVKCTSRSGTTLTVVREQESTTATAYSSGDIASLRLTAGFLEDQETAVAANTAKATCNATNVKAAGATMNSDTAVNSNSWVLDEDSMSSNSSTKVPTQQSVKAYVDNIFTTVAKTSGATLTAAECNGFVTITDEGAADGSGVISHTLPTGVEGMRCQVICGRTTAGDEVRLTPASGDDLYSYPNYTAYTYVGAGRYTSLCVEFSCGCWHVLRYRGNLEHS